MLFPLLHFGCDGLVRIVSAEGAYLFSVTSLWRDECLFCMGEIILVSSTFFIVLYQLSRLNIYFLMCTARKIITKYIVIYGNIYSCFWFFYNCHRLYQSNGVCAGTYQMFCCYWFWIIVIDYEVTLMMVQSHSRCEVKAETPKLQRWRSGKKPLQTSHTVEREHSMYKTQASTNTIK